ncbi:SH3 domain-containing protein [Streptomyces sp. NPDC051776]|uniref:SH3 domain-containing protein n=1 Tax=Streptomyces sp. NPDC051776 TaxID=3155414 RepID=UPI00342A2D45
MLTSRLGRCALAAAAGLLVVTGATAAYATTTDSGANAGKSTHLMSDYKGKVIAASGLNVRKQPWLSSPVVGFLPYGKIVSIECKVNGQTIDGNPRWYRINGYGGYAAARYIENIGPAPRWC